MYKTELTYTNFISASSFPNPNKTISKVFNGFCVVCCIEIVLKVILKNL